jgi:hypothetical protein
MQETSMWCSSRWRAEHLLLSLALCCAPGAWANPALLPGSRLQGEATLRFIGMRIYHARLWTQPDFQAGRALDHPLVLELEYLRDLDGHAIAERSLKEMRREGPVSEAQGQQWLLHMQRLFPNVKAGDRISGLNTPGQGVRFWHNGQTLGRVDDAEFARRFFGIWLAPTTSEPAMRQVLLGQGSPDPR